MSGKNKKNKGKVLSLHEFIADKAVPDGFDKKTINWADAMEDEDIGGPVEVVLPTAPKALRANEVDTSKVPMNPPFKAYLGNMPYETEKKDIEKLLGNARIHEIQIPSYDKSTGRGRGFAYVEFQDRDSLISSLKLNGITFSSRIIKISLPEEHDNRRAFGAKEGDEDRTTGDWRSGPRTAPTSNSRSHGSGFDNRPDLGPSRSDTSNAWREDSRGPSFQRDQGFARNGYSQDGHGHASQNRPFGSEFNQSSGPGYQDRSRGSYDRQARSYDGYGSRGNDYSGRSSGYDHQSSGYRDSNYGQQQGHRQETGGYSSHTTSRYDYQEDTFSRKEFGAGRPRQEDMSRKQYSHPHPDHQQQPSPAVTDTVTEAPKERPKLQLQPRTKPMQEIAAPAETTSTKSNPFGGARPVDTLQREMQIEEKLKNLDIKQESSSPTQPESETRPRKSSTSSSGTRSRKESETERPPTQILSRPHRQQQQDGRDFDRRNDRRGDRPFDNRGPRSAFGRNEQPPRRNMDSRGGGGGYSGSNSFNRSGPRDVRSNSRPEDRNTRPRIEKKESGQNGASKPEPEFQNKYQVLVTDEDETVEKPGTEE